MSILWPLSPSFVLKCKKKKKGTEIVSCCGALFWNENVFENLMNLDHKVENLDHKGFQPWWSKV